RSSLCTPLLIHSLPFPCPKICSCDWLLASLREQHPSLSKSLKTSWKELKTTTHPTIRTPSSGTNFDCPLAQRCAPNTTAITKSQRFRTERSMGMGRNSDPCLNLRDQCAATLQTMPGLYWKFSIQAKRTGLWLTGFANENTQ